MLCHPPLNVRCDTGVQSIVGTLYNIDGIVKLSEFDQKLGNPRIHNSLIVQYSGYWPEVENQSNLT